MTKQLLKLDPIKGLLSGQIIHRLSNHCDDRPYGIQIDMIVIHGISLPAGEFGSNTIEHFFCGQFDRLPIIVKQMVGFLKVSAHILIKRSGQLVQFVPFNKRAWHAGVSSFAGKTHCNDFSIGIELEGTDYIPYEKQQYDQLISVIQLLRQTYPAITAERIVGHADIAPGRKTDPGPLFNWTYLKGKLI